MMARHSILRATGVVSIFGAAGPELDEVGLSAWIAQAAPGETLVYHRGFLAVDATSVISKLPAEQQRALRLVERQKLAVRWEVNCIRRALGERQTPVVLLKGAA